MVEVLILYCRDQHLGPLHAWRGYDSCHIHTGCGKWRAISSGDFVWNGKLSGLFVAYVSHVMHELFVNGDHFVVVVGFRLCM